MPPVLKRVRRKDLFRNISIGLSVTLIILFIAFIVIICNYVKVRSLLNKESTCTSEECIRSSSSLRLAMDMSVNPCDDFYQYTCGHWSEEHPSHVWHPRFSNIHVLEERLSIAAEKCLKQNDSRDDPLPVKQSRKFYQSCMNVEEQNDLELTVIYKYLRKANLPLVPSFFDDPEGQIDFDWKQADVNLKKLFGIDLFMGFTVDADLFDTNNEVMYLGTPKTSFPPQRLSRISHLVKNVLALISPTPIDYELVQNASTNIWGTSLILFTQSVFYSARMEDTKKLSVKNIQAITDKVFQMKNLNPENIWEPYLRFMFTDVPNVSLDLKGEDLIYTTDEDLEYMVNMAVALKRIPAVHLELFTWWTAVFFMITKIGPEFLETTSYAGNHLNSLECTKLTTKYMGVAVNYGIADKTFIKKTKPKVEQMLSNIKDAFDQRIKEISWMDEVSKKLTLEKNKRMMSLIGYPDERLLERTGVEKYYENIYIRNDTYFDNVMQFISSSFPSKLANLRGRHKIPWPLDPISVNAFYLRRGNSLYVPMSILTFPMYDLGLEVLNYGSLGTILGHELTHGFDNSGGLYDQFGNYRNWWTANTIMQFLYRAQCFVQQYNSYKISPLDINIQGKATLGENIADNGGIHNAYGAYQNYLNTHEPDQKLPGFENFTNDQMFFIAFTSFHCEEINLETLEKQILVDNHSPGLIRVLGTLQNSEDFSKAFGCPKGSRMNPVTPKCRLW